MMTAIKLCGLSRIGDIEAANELKPEYIGFVFAKESKRYIPPWRAAELKSLLADGIQAVGVFVNENPETVARLLNSGMIHIAQLHGGEGEDYIRRLRMLTDKPILQAFCVRSGQDIANAGQSVADYVLLDSGAGGGKVFDWKQVKEMKRPYFLAGGLSPENVGEAIERLRPYAVDVSSGIETNGMKDKGKMAEFVAAVRREGGR